MSELTKENIDSSNDKQLFVLLGRELERRLSGGHGGPEFLTQLRQLPIGLRAMAATYELDVSLAMDDLGWHFGNWRSHELAEETATGLDELGATELAALFREAHRIAADYWNELGTETWTDWYHGSELEKAVNPLSARAWAILDPNEMGIFKYWVDYARRYPDRIGARLE